MDNNTKSIIGAFPLHGDDRAKKILAQHPEFYQNENTLKELINVGTYVFTKPYIQSNKINLEALTKAFLSETHPAKTLNSLIPDRYNYQSNLSLYPDNFWPNLVQSIYDNILDKERFITEFCFPELLSIKNLLTHSDTLLKTEPRNLGEFPKEFWTKDNLLKLFKNTNYRFNTDLESLNESKMRLKIDCSNLSQINEPKVAWDIFQNLNKRKWTNKTRELCVYETVYFSFPKHIQNDLDLCKDLVFKDKHKYFILSNEMKNNIEIINDVLSIQSEFDPTIRLKDLPKSAQEVWKAWKNEPINSMKSKRKF